jgi:hypothetical protein
MKISNGHELHELQLIDRESGTEWTKDFLNASEWAYNEETETYTKEDADMEYILGQALDMKYGRGDFDGQVNDVQVLWDGQETRDAVAELEQNDYVKANITEPVNPDHVWINAFGRIMYADESNCLWELSKGLVRWKEERGDWSEWHGC